MSKLARSRLEAAAAVLFAVITVVTALWPDWIERVAGFAPDGGSGTTEWGLVILSGVVSVALAALSRRDHRQWRRLQQTDAQAQTS